MKHYKKSFTKFIGGIMVGIMLVCTLKINVNAETVSGYNGQALYNEESVYHDYVFANIEKIYGTDAKNAYINGVITGDYTQFRTLIGDWRPVCKLDGVNVKFDGTSYVNNEINAAQSYEAVTYTLFGKYGTVSDLFTYASQCGYDISDNNQFNSFKLDVILWKTVPYPAKKKAPSTAATTTTSTSDKKVEALKSYKKNSSEFNAYNYYSRYTDLQSAIGPNGDALLKHWNEFGKKEGRIGK